MLPSSRRLLAWSALAAAAAGFALATATTAEIRRGFLNSDLLLPAAFVRDLLHHPDTIGWFQLPRVPSFFPDLGLVLALSALAPWRVAALIYAAFVFTLFVLTCGAVTAKLADRPTLQSTSMFLALAAAAMLLDLDLNGGSGAYFLIFFPAIHSGAFLVALWGLLLVERCLRAPRAGPAIALAGAAALATLSDRMQLAMLAAPAWGGTALLLLAPGGRASVGLRRAMNDVAGLSLGCLAGIVLDQLLFSAWLLRQPDLFVLRSQLARIPALLREPSTHFAALCALAVIALPGFWARASCFGRFWWGAGAATSLAIAALLPLVYLDATATRYAQPIWWWALIVLAAAALRLAPRAAPAAATCVAGALLLATMRYRSDLFALRQVTEWRDAVERCVSGLHAKGEIHAGLADYWLARPLEASSDWRVQVAQITERGWAFYWGTNWSVFGRDAAGAPPDFDFLITARLDRQALAARFGEPDRITPCAGAEIWQYADAARLRTRIVGAASWARRDRLLAEPLWFSPADLDRRAADGELSLLPSGSTLTGPAALLRPGRWTLHLDYSFAPHSTAPHDWTVALAGAPAARGPLEPGHQIALTSFDVPDLQPLFELRFATAPGDQLRVEQLSLTPAGQ